MNVASTSHRWGTHTCVAQNVTDHYALMARRRLKSPASRLFTQPFIQTQIKENIKSPRHWPLCGEVTGTGDFPAQRTSYAENASISWRHHDTHQCRVMRNTEIKMSRNRHQAMIRSNTTISIGTLETDFSEVQKEITISIRILTALFEKW